MGVPREDRRLDHAHLRSVYVPAVRLTVALNDSDWQAAPYASVSARFRYSRRYGRAAGSLSPTGSAHRVRAMRSARDGLQAEKDVVPLPVKWSLRSARQSGLASLRQPLVSPRWFPQL